MQTDTKFLKARMATLQLTGFLDWYENKVKGIYPITNETFERLTLKF